MNVLENGTAIEHFSSNVGYAEYNSTTMTVVFVTVLIIATLAVFFHLLGMVLIITKASEMTNKSLLLLHLSCVSVALLACHLLAAHQYWAEESIENPKARLVIVFFTLYVAYIVNIILIVLDRVFLAFSNIGYTLVLAKGKIVSQLICLWFLAILFGISTTKPQVLKNTDIRTKVSFIYDGFVTGFTLICYVVIYFRVKKSEVWRQTSATIARDLHKNYLIPIFMVATVFLLNLVPSFIKYEVGRTAHARVVAVSLIGLSCLNNLLDAAIYIFLQRKLRNKLVELSRRCFDRLIVYKTINDTKITDVEERENYGYGNDME